MKKVFDRIGIGQKDDFGHSYEEWFITDYDCYVDGLYDKLGEYESLDELNYLASKLDEMSQGEYEQFQAAMEVGDHSGSLQEIIKLTENLDCYDVYPDIHDHDDLGRYYIDELETMFSCMWIGKDRRIFVAAGVVRMCVNCHVWLCCGKPVCRLWERAYPFP